MCAAVVQDRGKHEDTSGDGDEASGILPAAGNVINWGTAVAHNDMRDAETIAAL